jgi:hypothetical protein
MIICHRSDDALPLYFISYFIFMNALFWTLSYSNFGIRFLKNGQKKMSKNENLIGTMISTSYKTRCD